MVDFATPNNVVIRGGGAYNKVGDGRVISLSLNRIAVLPSFLENGGKVHWAHSILSLAPLQTRNLRRAARSGVSFLHLVPNPIIIHFTRVLPQKVVQNNRKYKPLQF